MRHLIALLLALTPAAGAHARTITVAPGESVWVEESGSGTPVVLLPGLLGTAFGYRHVSARLAERGYRAIVVEPLGVGRSSRPRHADWSMAAQADRVAAALGQLGVGDAIVVGHGQAASVGYRLAYRHPERVRGLVSIDGGPVEHAVTPRMRRALRWGPLIHLAGSARVRGKVAEGLAGASRNTDWLTPDVVARYVEWTSDLGGALRVLQAMKAAREPETLAANLGRIRCPVLLLASAADEAPEAGEVALLRRGIADFAAQSLPAVGHYIQEERPDLVVEGVERVDRWSRTALQAHARAVGAR